MHNLARGCPAKRRLPRVRAPRTLHSCRECIWGFGFDSTCEKDSRRGRAMPLGRNTGPDATRHPARSPRPDICNPYRIEFCLGSVTRGSHVPWQPRARISKSFRLAPAPGSIPLGQAQFLFPLGRDDRRPQESPRPRVVDVKKHQDMQVIQTCSGPGRIPLGQAQFRSTTNSRQRHHEPRSTVHDLRLLR